MKNNITGLVVCGGKSSRMNEDKSLLEYHGISQREFLFDLLSGSCEKVFLSMNKEQSGNYSDRFPFITDEDEFAGSGPLCSLLSFRKHHPGESLLIVGCDYPFVNAGTIQLLFKHRTEPATCFVHDDGTPEPLITIYEDSFLNALPDFFDKGNFSLSKILKESGANMIEPPSHKLIENVNTPDEYFLAKEYIKYKNIMF